MSPPLGSSLRLEESGMLNLTLIPLWWFSDVDFCVLEEVENRTVVILPKMSSHEI